MSLHRRLPRPAPIRCRSSRVCSSETGRPGRGRPPWPVPSGGPPGWGVLSAAAPVRRPPRPRDPHVEAGDVRVEPGQKDPALVAALDRGGRSTGVSHCALPVAPEPGRPSDQNRFCGGRGSRVSDGGSPTNDRFPGRPGAAGPLTRRTRRGRRGGLGPTTRTGSDPSGLDARAPPRHRLSRPRGGSHSPRAKPRSVRRPPPPSRGCFGVSSTTVASPGPLGCPDERGSVHPRSSRVDRSSRPEAT